MAPMLRGENGNPGDFEFFYGEVNDLIAAAEYLSNLSYVDNKSIFLCGHSVGGSLSMLTSMMSSKYRAISSFGGFPDQESFMRYSGPPIPFDLKSRKESELRSSIAYQDSIIKPIFVYIGDREDPSTIDYCRDFFMNEKEIGKPCEFKVVKGDHFTSVEESVRLTIAEFRDIQSYEALAFNRSRAYSIFLEGNDLFNQSKFEDAISSFDQATKIDPQCALAWNGKGAAIASMGNYSEALQCFQRAIDIDGELIVAWENKASALMSLGKRAEGVLAIDKARQLNYPAYLN
jgi:tetratricopeptide (TPR) repeat protein